MFPQNQYKTTVTIFTPYTDNVTGLVRYFRRVLNRCFWNADSVSVNRAGGIAAPEQVDLNIPLVFNPGYVNRAEWVNAPKLDLDNIWTLRPGTATEWTIIIKGEADFPQLEQWRNPEDMGRQLQSLRRELGAAEHRPSNVDEILFGPASMHRIVAAC